MLVFLFESGLLGMMGGLLGIAFGITLSKIAEILARQAVGSDMLTAAISNLHRRVQALELSEAQGRGLH